MFDIRKIQEIRGILALDTAARNQRRTLCVVIGWCGAGCAHADILEESVPLSYYFGSPWSAGQPFLTGGPIANWTTWIPHSALHGVLHTIFDFGLKTQRSLTMKAKALIKNIRRSTPEFVRTFLIGFTISAIATIDGPGD